MKISVKPVAEVIKNIPHERDVEACNLNLKGGKNERHCLVYETRKKRIDAVVTTMGANAEAFLFATARSKAQSKTSADGNTESFTWYRDRETDAETETATKTSPRRRSSTRPLTHTTLSKGSAHLPRQNVRPCSALLTATRAHQFTTSTSLVEVVVDAKRNGPSTCMR